MVCARTLRRKLTADRYDVILFNRENHMVFQPLLAEVVGASIGPAAVAMPLRQMLPRVRCRAETVLEVDLKSNRLSYAGLTGEIVEMDYDHLILACGGDVNMGLIPGMADHAFPLRTLGDAFALRAHVMEQLEKAEVCDDPKHRQWLLSFIVVGGGFSGVEVVGEINDLVRGSEKFFPHVALDEIVVTLIHSRDSILPEVSPQLREFAKEKMQQLGITMALERRVELVTSEGVGTVGGEMIAGATVVCTIGNTMAPLIEQLAVDKERGRLRTDPDMRISGYPNAWATGDCARIVNAYDGSISPATGQFAERQGRQVVANILREIKGEPTQPFSFKPLGQLCAIGGKHAVAEMFGQRLSGFSAWFLWRTVYLLKVPSFSRKIKVAFDWTWELLFSRDLAHLKANQTERVRKAYYKEGDYVFRQGEPGANFYVIEKGEVEVVHVADADEEKVIAVLGPGDFFGEMALIEKQRRSASVRARTRVEVVVMGSTVFNQISSSLAPLRELIFSAIRRRRSISQQIHASQAVLDNQPLSSFVEDLPTQPMKPGASLREAVEIFSRKKVDLCCVADESGLVGIITRTDLMRALEAATAAQDENKVQIELREIMVTNPAMVTLEDSSTVALSTMRQRGISKLPVVRNSTDRSIQGYIRIEKLMEAIMKNIQPASIKKSDHAAP